MKWPTVIKQAYAKIWGGKYSRIIIKAPRGGGKSKLLGTVGFDYWYLKNRKVVNMAGSAVQATIVYNYFRGYCDIDTSIEETFVKGKLKAIQTDSVDGNYFSSVTSSSKQVRGKHPDVLISDETCESEDSIIHAALPMVDSSQNPLVVMASTFHKIYGVFQETWDNAEERGYLRIQWDIFDVCKQFDVKYWDKPEIARIGGIERLKAMARGRTGDPDGWVNIDNIIQAWKEKPNEDWFLVEYMGSRPSSAGLVLNPEDVDASLFDLRTEKEYNYIKGATCVLGIDWGFSTMTSVIELMGHKDGVVVKLDNKNFHQIKSDDIIKYVVKKVREHGIRFIYADSAGKFENVALQSELDKQKLGCRVIEVVFGTEKERMLGNFRAHFENKKFKLPTHIWHEKDEKDNTDTSRWIENKEAYWQYKRYRYQEGSDKPVKKDDHIPDATMCALEHFPLGIYARPIPVQETKQRIIKKEEKINSEKPITVGLMSKTF